MTDVLLYIKCLFTYLSLAIFSKSSSPRHDKLTQCCRAFTLALARLSCTLPPGGAQSTVMTDKYVHLSVRSNISKSHGETLPKFLHDAYCCGSVLLGQHCDMLCIFGFVDDVIFSRNGPMACQAAIERDKQKSRDSNQILLNNKDQQVS